MSNVRQRARIARVRKIQHGMAALAATRAQDHVQALENNEQRLQQMRVALGAAAGVCMGADLASRGELAMRLEAAELGLAKAVALREQARIGARRDQESAEQLEQRAASAIARKQDRRSAALFRPRPRKQIEGEET
jgi:hypothetical protein